MGRDITPGNGAGAMLLWHGWYGAVMSPSNKCVCVCFCSQRCRFPPAVLVAHEAHEALTRDGTESFQMDS